MAKIQNLSELSQSFSFTVALMFLKMYTQTSSPKLMEQLNGNVHYQIFCGIRINPENPLTNYKLIDDIACGFSFLPSLE